MQRERVEEQYPWTWEIPLGVVCAIIALAVAFTLVVSAIGSIETGTNSSTGGGS